MIKKHSTAFTALVWIPCAAYAWSSHGVATLYDEVHQTAIRNVIAGRVTSAALDRLAEQQAETDAAQYQSTANSYMHSMTGLDGSMPPAQLRTKYIGSTDRWINQKLKEAIDLRKQQKELEAMAPLGIALHALEDATSPSHQCFLPWDENEWFGAKAIHFMPERFYPDPGQYRSRLEGVVRWAFDIYTEATPLPKQFFDANGAVQLPGSYNAPPVSCP